MTRPYVLSPEENIVLEMPVYDPSGNVDRYSLVVRRRVPITNGTQIEYWLREYSAQGIETFNQPQSFVTDAIQTVFARAGWGEWGERSDEPTFTLDEIVAKVMDHHRGCEEGKREFLADAFGWNAMSRHWGSVVNVTITQTYTINDGFAGDPDAIFESVAHAIRTENLTDVVEGLDQNESQIVVSWA